MAIKNDQYNRIIREYDSQNLRNKHDLDRRIAHAYNLIPRLKELEEEIITLSAASGRKALFGNSDSLYELKDKILTLKAQQIELLVQEGLPDDYLEMHYKCVKCHDTGYINNEKCNCFKQSIINLMYTDSNIEKILEKENFNMFSFRFYSDEYVDNSLGISPLSNMHKIVSNCKNFIRDFGKKHDNLLFLGNTGVGKTFLANCIAKELLDKGYTVVYLTSFQLFNILEKNTFERDVVSSTNASNQFEYLLCCDLLIIDDLGTELNNSFTGSQMYLVINERLLNQKSTIISTNYSLPDIKTVYSERVYSRIISNYAVQYVFGEDIRLLKAINPAES